MSYLVLVFYKLCLEVCPGFFVMIFVVPLVTFVVEYYGVEYDGVDCI